MAQDIRALLERDRELCSEKMSSGHEARFLERLEAEFPESKSSISYAWIKIAASIVLVLSLAGGWLLSGGTAQAGAIVAAEPSEDREVIEKQSALAGISPEYKAVETYYNNSIKLALSKLTINDINKDLIDSFMQQLAQLDKEYEALNTELIELGTSAQTVQALIDNLQLRLNLMMRLKTKLNTLKQITNEGYQDQQA